MSSKDNRKKGADIETDVEMKDKKEEKTQAESQPAGGRPRTPAAAQRP